MPLSLVTPPVAEPLNWTTVQKQLHLDGLEDEGEFLSTFVIPAARDRGELATRRAFMGPQTWDYVLDGFPRDPYIEIPKPPLIAVTSFTYVDMGGVTRTLVQGTNFLVQAPAGPRCARGRVALPFASVWPIALPQMGAVTIRFTCGYAGTTNNPAAGMPPLLISALLTDCGRLYEHRESLVVDTRAAALEVPGTAKDIYKSFRSWGRQRLTGLDAVWGAGYACR